MTGQARNNLFKSGAFAPLFYISKLAFTPESDNLGGKIDEFNKIYEKGKKFSRSGG
jgi:hypothetical protein